MAADSLPEYTKKPSVRHRVEHALLVGAIKFTRLLGTRGATRFGGAIGKLGYKPLGIRRKVAEENLRAAFPEKDEAWIQHITRETYAHLAREALATLQLSEMSVDEIRACTNVSDEQFAGFVEDLQLGKGIVMVSGHLGNHEMAAAALAVRGIPMDVVVQRQGNPLFDKTLNDARQSHGLGIIDRFKATRQAIRSLHQGRVVAFAADQNAGKTGAFVPFFGRLASTHKGPAFFAARTGAPFYVGVALRNGDRYDVFGHRIDVDREGELDDVVYRLTAAFTAYLEEVVRTAPDQYLWLHRRWKSKPPQ